MTKLRLVVQEVPMERLALSVRSAVMEQLREYRAYYEEQLKGKVQLNYLLEEIIKSCIAEDKDFQKYLKALANEGKTRQKLPAQPDETGADHPDSELDNGTGN